MTELIPGVERKAISYAEYRNGNAKDCDIALFEPWNWIGRLISRCTGGPFSHCGLLVSHGTRGHERLMLCEYSELYGGHALPFSNVVGKHDGGISIFRVEGLEPETYRAIALDAFTELGDPYAWKNIRLIALGHFIGLTGAQWYRDLVDRRSANMPGRICSQHVATCYANHFVYFVRKKLGLVTPNDLALSTRTTYIGTLVG